MKIRKLWMIKLVGLVGAIVIRLWLATLRPLLCLPLPHIDPRRRSDADRFIYVFWHENILLPCYLFGRCHINVLISQHADGEMITQVCRHLGYGAIRGSKTRGGIQAMRKMLRDRRRFHIAVMPDGPRGPRRHVEMGVVYLAAKTGMPIIVCGIGYDRPWRLKTWDRFALPRPFSKARIVTFDPIHVPADVAKDKMEGYRQHVQAELERACEMAEKWANPQMVSRDAPVEPRVPLARCA